jgi:hypothetical protein
MGAAPISFVCPVARRNQTVDYDGYHDEEARTGRRVSIRPYYRYPGGHTKIVRTGRVRGLHGDGVLPEKDYGSRTTRNQYEYRCECGHVGWSKHVDILRRPLGCPDGGWCHHADSYCTPEAFCFRVAVCEPLSNVFPNDEWPRRYAKAPS